MVVGRGKGVVTEWSDGEMLLALDLCERQGLSRHQAAEQIAAQYGTGRQANAVIGVIHRINAKTDAVPCRCRKPENRDGGMPPQWWADGLRAQEARGAKAAAVIVFAVGSREDRLRRALAYAVQHSGPAARLVGAGDDLVFESDSLIRNGEDAANYLRVRFVKTDLQLYWIDEAGQGGPLLVALPASLQGPLRGSEKLPKSAAKKSQPKPAAVLPKLDKPSQRVPVAQVGRADLVAGIARHAWTPTSDLLIFWAKAQSMSLSAVATDLKRPLREVEARWHRLRVVRGLEAALVAYLAQHGDSYAPPSAAVSA